MPENTSVDLNTVVAVIALVVSLTGTILSPIITSVINNRHQRKMFQLSEKSSLDKEKQHILVECISNIGAAYVQASPENMDAFGKSFHCVYAFVSTDKWSMLDDFYAKFILLPFDGKVEPSDLAEVIHYLTGLLKEISQ